MTTGSGAPEPLELSAQDRRELERRGLSEREVRVQLRSFREGFPPLHLDRPCTAGDGILRLNQSDHEASLRQWEEGARRGRLSKFVPASGAASRMFRAPLSVMAEVGQLTDAEMRELEKSDDPQHRDTFRLLQEIDRFAFAPLLRDSLREAGLDADALLAHGDRRVVLEHLLQPQHLGLAELAKGSIPFHRYGDRLRNAFEEHVDEASSTVGDSSGTVRVHFTVPPAQRSAIEASLRERLVDLPGGASQAQISFSVQQESTDTIAVDLDNRPFRDAQGRLVFRPGGHGALLRNLDGLGADIVLIRNIDNVTIAPVREPTILHERLLVGLTLELQRKIHELLKQAVEGQMSEVALDDALRWCEQALEASIMPEIWKATVEQRQSHLRHILDRPLRVCAMVRNEGEPGGGPYWVREEDGSISKQIVESSQVDFERDDQREIFRAATHFNPVDMVCALRDPFGKGYSLERFVDARRGFIARKSHEGRPLKALERPGLWNGAMAGWNTVFVEVPVETFNPVKTVLDLLRPAHQPR